MKVERKADHAVSEASCKEASGKTLAEWFKALDKHGGIPLGRRELSKWRGTRTQGGTLVVHHHRQRI